MADLAAARDTAGETGALWSLPFTLRPLVPVFARDSQSCTADLTLTGLKGG
jgi:hypothetical protein